MDEASRDCVESVTLRRLLDASKDEDSITADDLENAIAACMLLVQPFIKSLEDVVLASSARPLVCGVAPSADGTYRAQMKTINGSLVSVPHDLVYEEMVPASPVPNPVSGVVEVPVADLMFERPPVCGLATVGVNSELLFLKQVYRLPTSESFIREAVVLSKLPKHPNLVSLRGVVVLPNGNVDGLLLDLIDGVTLGAWLRSGRARPSAELKEQWKAQILAGVAAVHKAGQVWGDAKPDNIMIDKNNCARLFDFDGGYTGGWVPKELRGEAKGDIAAVQRIFKDFVDKM